MRIVIETRGLRDFAGIRDEYGSVLNQFGLERTFAGGASIEIDSLADLFTLDRDLKRHCDEIDRPLPYFGLLIQSREDGTPYVEIKDNYD